jgi:hypothetical protein
VSGARRTSAARLGITGKVQSDSGVVNLVAEELWVPKLESRPPRLPIPALRSE